MVGGFVQKFRWYLRSVGVKPIGVLVDGGVISYDILGGGVNSSEVSVGGVKLSGVVYAGVVNSLGYALVVSNIMMPCWCDI